MPHSEVPCLPAAEIWAICDGSRQPVISAVTGHLLATEGKLIRSAMLLEICGLGPAPDNRLAPRAAAVIEAIHLASLVHDDVIDDSGRRRGNVTIGPRFGGMAAALAGGWLFARAAEAMTGCGDELVERLAVAITQTCAGQMLEMEDLHNPERAIDRYWDAVRGKTAALFVLAAGAGARLGQFEPPACAAFEEFGLHFGMAFQLADDVQDLVADDRVTGKPRGSDVRRGVYTLPVLYGLAESPSLRELVARRAGRDDQAELIQAILQTRGVSRALADCLREARAAVAAVSAVVPDGDREGLERLVERVIAPAGIAL